MERLRQSPHATFGEPSGLVEYPEALPERSQVQQGQLQDGQVPLAILDLSLDVVQPFDIRLDEPGVEDAAGPAAHDAQRQSKPVGVLESHHRRDGLDLLLAGVLRRGHGLGELIHPAASILGTDVLDPWDPLSEVRRGDPVHGFPLLEPGIDLVVGELPVVGHLLRLDREQASLVAHSLSRAEPEWHLEGHPSHRSVDQAALAPTAGGRRTRQTIGSRPTRESQARAGW